MKEISIKRIYEKPDSGDGYRILVDRLWPRGVSKEAAHIDEWAKELGPSDELRKWFGHVPEKFPEFSAKYKRELKSQTEALKRIRKFSNSKKICLLYGAKDEKHNQAVVLKSVLESI